MKIYLLACEPQFQPKKNPFRYPRHSEDWGIEQDFLTYVSRNRQFVTNNPAEADWHYLPIFWTRWHCSHKYGATGLIELQAEVHRILQNDAKTFTICQYDDGPLVNLGQTIMFWASRKNESGIDAPLLCSPHRSPFFRPKKKYLASFIGRFATHPIRQAMAAQLAACDDVYLEDTPDYNRQRPAKFFVRKLFESYIALCPRGHGGSSFRFFEAMQVGTVPFLIGDLDTRPFKQFIKWDDVSFYANTTAGLQQFMQALDLRTLAGMGRQAKEVYKKELAYQHWCKYVLQELKELR